MPRSHVSKRAPSSTNSLGFSRPRISRYHIGRFEGAVHTIGHVESRAHGVAAREKADDALGIIPRYHCLGKRTVLSREIKHLAVEEIARPPRHPENCHSTSLRGSLDDVRIGDGFIAGITSSNERILMNQDDRALGRAPCLGEAPFVARTGIDNAGSETPFRRRRRPPR